MRKILVIGASGQIGTELTVALRNQVGVNNVIASDIRGAMAATDGLFIQLDALDKNAIYEVVRKHHVGTIYHLSAILSASGEVAPKLGWDLNMQSLLNVLEIAHDAGLDKVFWPSSIAVFGRGAPKVNCPQDAIQQPSTVYGISKSAGELWCSYYHSRFGVDVRSLRYPGLISYQAMPGGGTTDYAVDIFHKAIADKKFTCFLREDTRLPMMYMPDAIRATLELMDAPADRIVERTSYNVSSLSFTPLEIANAIQSFIPEFTMDYAPDFRQVIADSWPGSIDDSKARADWGWREEYDLDVMTGDMLHNLELNLQSKILFNI